MKYSKLLRFLLAPFFLFAAGDDAGGGTGGAEVEDRGDTLADGAPELEIDPATITDPMVDEDEEKEEEGEPKTEAKAKDGKKDTRIPLARHKEMLDKGRADIAALQAENARLKQGTQVAQTNEAIEATEVKLVAMEGEYNKLLADGEIEKATAKMSEIRRLERSVGDQKSDMKAEQAETRAVERVRYDTVVDRIEAAFPVMNPDNEAFDTEVVGEVLGLKNAFEGQGLTPSAALQKAVKYVLGAETGKEKTAVEVKPNATPAEVALLRKQEALKRNIDAAKKTPASTTKVGQNSDELGGVLSAETAMKLSQDAFAKISEEDLARMRGDVL